jgi:hypothetical protein
MYPYSSVVSNIQDKCIRDYTGVRIHLSCMLLTTRSTDTFVLYATDYIEVRIHLSCMLLTTLEYGYICLVLFLTTRSTDILSCMLLTTLKYGYLCLVWYWLHWVVSSIQDKCIRTPVESVTYKTNVSVLQCSQEQYKTNISVLQCSQ